jgi:hypothetical protein
MHANSAYMLVTGNGLVLRTTATRGRGRRRIGRSRTAAAKSTAGGGGGNDNDDEDNNYMQPLRLFVSTLHVHILQGATQG